MKNDKGSSLVMLLLIMAILSILGMAILQMSINDNKFSIKEHEYQQTYYIARAGAEATAEYLTKNRLSNSQLNELISKDTDDVINKNQTNFAGGSFRVSLLTNSSNNIFIQSIGSYKGHERTVKLGLKKMSLFESAVVVMDKIVIENPSNNRIYGDIATLNNPETSIVDKHGNSLSESMLNTVLDDTYDYYQTSGLYPPAIKPMLPLTTGNKANLIGGTIYNNSGDDFANTEIGDLNLGSSDLTINLNSSDMSLIFDKLKANNSTLKVKGDGILKLYVNEIDDFKGDIIIGDDAKVVLIVYSNGDINLKTGSSVSNLYIYAPTAEVSLKANYLVVGSIIAESINFESGADIEFSANTGVFPDDLGIDMYSFELSEWTY